MNKPEIIAIAALGKDTHFICEGDNLLWHNPEDLKRVKELTLGFPLIMGRKTYESIGRPLPKRTNIILTRDESYSNENCNNASNCVVTHTLEEALERAKQSEGGDRRIFIFGGSEIYNLYLHITDTLMLTLYNSEKPGTQKFPKYEESFKFKKSHGKGVFEGEDFEWVDYERKSS